MPYHTHSPLRLQGYNSIVTYYLTFVNYNVTDKEETYELQNLRGGLGDARAAGGGRVMRQFFCKDKAEAIAKVTEWMDKAVKIEVIPA